MVKMGQTHDPIPKDMIQLQDCSHMIQEIVNKECKALYEKFRKEVQCCPMRHKLKLRKSHKKESDRLFWRHAFLMASDVNSTQNIQVPRVDCDSLCKSKIVTS